MQHYLIRLNLTTQAQYHRIFWTASTLGADLPLNDVAAAYEIYRKHISNHQGYKYASDHHYIDENLDIRTMAYAEEDEYGFEWGDLKIELETEGSPMTLQVIGLEKITKEQFDTYRHGGMCDNHLDIQL